ncbi:biotin/lipoyl-containing protein, partial [Noviherbaspirillum sp.]|uniref:biotin/lipoyl-containing protein n=1 Tax=Noviherbaspirillum sp. TaxID=1926288 RepID=UPI002FDF9FC6
MGMQEVKVPDIGDFKEVEVIELMVKPGDTVKVDQSLITVESDKASMEIPSSHAGVVKELKIKVGDKVSEGTLLLILEEAGASAAPPAGAAPAGQQSTPQPVPLVPATSAAPASSAASSGSVDVLVPDIGDFSEVEVIELMVKPGDAVKVDQSLVTVESDKASMEIPSSHAGIVKELKVKVGDKVSKGSQLLTLAGEGGSSASSAPVPAAAPGSSDPV